MEDGHPLLPFSGFSSFLPLYSLSATFSLPYSIIPILPVDTSLKSTYISRINGEDHYLNIMVKK